MTWGPQIGSLAILVTVADYMGSKDLETSYSKGPTAYFSEPSLCTPLLWGRCNCLSSICPFPGLCEALTVPLYNATRQKKKKKKIFLLLATKGAGMAQW